LSGTQFSPLNSAGINDPEGPGTYNNTEVKYGATFYSNFLTLSHMNTSFNAYATSADPDQHAHPSSLTSIYAVRFSVRNILP
jgi:hypothetical protein